MFNIDSTLGFVNENQQIEEDFPQGLCVHSDGVTYFDMLNVQLKTMQTNTTFPRSEEAIRGLYNQIICLSVITTLLVVSAIVVNTLILTLLVFLHDASRKSLLSYK